MATDRTRSKRDLSAAREEFRRLETKYYDRAREGHYDPSLDEMNELFNGPDGAIFEEVMFGDCVNDSPEKSDQIGLSDLVETTSFLELDDDDRKLKFLEVGLFLPRLNIPALYVADAWIEESTNPDFLERAHGVICRRMEKAPKGDSNRSQYEYCLHTIEEKLGFASRLRENTD